MTTLTEWNYAVALSHTEFKLRMLVVLDITCVIVKCPLSSKTGFYDNMFVTQRACCLELKHGTWILHDKKDVAYQPLQNKDYLV